MHDKFQAATTVFHSRKHPGHSVPPVDTARQRGGGSDQSTVADRGDRRTKGSRNTQKGTQSPRVWGEHQAGKIMSKPRQGAKVLWWNLFIVVGKE